jgi:hypothetical protein
MLTANHRISDRQKLRRAIKALTITLALGGPLLLPAHIFAQGAPAAMATTHTAPGVAVEYQARQGLPNFFKALQEGKEVRIAYLGGSITEAAGWRVFSRQWFQQQYPQAKVQEIDAAISGTGAEYGAGRVGRDVLSKQPTLLFVEFAVNGAGTTEQRQIRSMEGIVRQTLANDPNTDICFVYTIHTPYLTDLQAGKLPPLEIVMEKIADHYGIPSINFGLEVAKQVQAGKLVYKGKAATAPAGSPPVFSEDGTHPLGETGHKMYLEAIKRNMPAIKAAGTAGPHTIPAPLDPASWSKVTEVTFDQVRKTAGWKHLDLARDMAGKDLSKKVPSQLWLAGKPGEAFEVKFNGNAFGFDGFKGPDVGKFKVSIDGGPPQTFTHFDSFCLEGRYRTKPWFWPDELSSGEHTARVEVLADPINKVADMQAHGVKIKNPGSFDGLNLYVGDIMVAGEIIPPASISLP